MDGDLVGLVVFPEKSLVIRGISFKVDELFRKFLLLEGFDHRIRL
jgi:hypothetical protein